ncbi:MAG TPA: tRNA (guanosine(37)-N1)-methyltransferase TrmD [Candidatus Paceibacterota bacterium]
MMHFHVVTLFSQSIDSYIHESILGRAIKDKKIAVDFYNPRNFTKNKHRRVDGRPYGGGPGMVMEAEPILKAIQKAIGQKKKTKILFFSPSGKQFDSTYAKKLATNYSNILLISGHYEGIDVRVKKAVKAEAISIGPYVLTGGEIPVAVVIDAVSRFIPGVLGNTVSLEENRVSSSEVYTRPDVFMHKGKKYRVPAVLRSGDHKKIDAWKQKTKR